MIASKRAWCAAGDPEELALCAWSATHGLSALAVDGQLSDLAGRLGELAQAVTANVYLGLGPRSTPDDRRGENILTCHNSSSYDLTSYNLS